MSQATVRSAHSELLCKAMEGDEESLGDLLQRHRGRLERLITLRLDRRTIARVDPSDILQDTFVLAAKRFSEYRQNPSLPFDLWLRFLATQRLIDHHRFHLSAQARDVRREVPIEQALTETHSAPNALQRPAETSNPSSEVIGLEERMQLDDAMNRLHPSDREILALRHFEQLSNGEVARVLGLDKSAASKRYARALSRLKNLL